MCIYMYTARARPVVVAGTKRGLPPVGSTHTHTELTSPRLRLSVGTHHYLLSPYILVHARARAYKSWQIRERASLKERNVAAADGMSISPVSRGRGFTFPFLMPFVVLCRVLRAPLKNPLSFMSGRWGASEKT